VKCGWLRKQGGIVRSWHRRYFVMKGDYIFYYASDDDCTSGKPPLGSVFLPGNRVVEIPFSSGDAEKFQFEIQTGLFAMLPRSLFFTGVMVLSSSEDRPHDRSWSCFGMIPACDRRTVGWMVGQNLS